MRYLNALFYEFAYWITAFVLSVFFGLRVTGGRNVPKRGAALLVANHQSFLDPPAIGLGAGRHLQYLARKTLFKNPVFGWLLSRLNSVPIDQEGIGIEGIRNIIERLRNGHAVLVFPEGERTWDGNMNPLKPGIALLFKRVNVPIVPVGIVGAYEAWPRWRKWPVPSAMFLRPSHRALGVAYGKPRDPVELLKLPKKEMLDLLTSDITGLMKQAEKVARFRVRR
jgi:1-acyl-sn-glycerol-3-phosphate acyltransferase